jgi:hypothetical protein
MRRVCRVDRHIADYLDCNTTLVHIRRDYAHEILRPHRFNYRQLPLLGVTIEFGWAFADKRLHMTFLYEDRVVTGRVLKATIKTNGKGTELLVCTFHRVEGAVLRSRLKRDKLIRPAKE